MKKLLIAVVVLLIFSGCEEKKNPVSGTMIDSIKRAQELSEAVNLDSVKKAVQQYHTANEKYPAGLDEIKDLVDTSKIDLSKYDYNPQTGVVSIKK